MTEELVSIIIVNWNGKRWLEDCFSTLHDQAYKNFEIIFVDNASTDDSITWVEKKYPKTKIIRNSKNLGFAGANNIGFKYAKGAYVLFLNNDTKVTKTFLIELVTAVNNPAIAGAQSKILLMDNNLLLDSVGAFLTPTGFLYHYGFGRADNPKYDKKIDLYTAKGACMLFKKSVLDRIAFEGNIFDKDYFAYFEESDMCHKVLLSGKRIVYAYKSIIFHKMGATSSGMNNAFIQYHSFKNRIRTYIKNFGKLNLLTIVPIHLILCEGFSLISIIKGKSAVGWGIQKAILWNIINLPGTLRQRRFVQGTVRSGPDYSMLKSVMRYPPLSYYVGLATGNVHD